MYWTADEIDLSHDLKNWQKLTDDERYFIENILAFFAASDGIVLENLLERFISEVDILEARMFYTFQATIENIHSEMYSRLIEALIVDPDKKNTLFNAINNIPSIQKKAEWAIKWIGSNDSFEVRLIAFAVVEGIFFSGAFCAIDWTRMRNLGLSGICASNDMISRDEALHTLFAVHFYNNKTSASVSNTIITNLISEAVEIEKEFITEALPCSLLGINADLMKVYIEFLANRLAAQLNSTKIYEDAYQPFSWMEMRNYEEVVNFFEKRSNIYKKKVIRDYSEVDTIHERNDLCFDDDFDL